MKNATFSFDEKVLEAIEKISKESLIPKSRLVDKALRDLIKSYGIDLDTM